MVTVGFDGYFHVVAFRVGIRIVQRRLRRGPQRAYLNGNRIAFHRRIHALEGRLRGEYDLVADQVGNPDIALKLRFAVVDLHGFCQGRIHIEGYLIAVVVDALVGSQLHAGNDHLEGPPDLGLIAAIRGKADGNIVSDALRQVFRRYGELHGAAGSVVAVLVIKDVFAVPGRHADVVPALAGIRHADQGVAAAPHVLRHLDIRHRRGIAGLDVHGDRFAGLPLFAEPGHGIQRALAGIAVSDH